MGFHLDCLLTVDRAAVALFEQLVPGGREWVVPVRGEGLPDGWVMPHPLLLEGLDVAEDWALDAAVGEWRREAGVPAGPDPLDAFDDTDLRCASLLSLAAPAGVVYLKDETFGGVLFHEHAAVFTGGRLRAAYGIDFGDRHRRSRAFELRDGAYAEANPGEILPVTRCASILDPRFREVSLFDGYLPRNSPPPFPQPADVETLALDPATTRKWSPYFPFLTRLPARSTSR
ncbi:hypothetical protein [Actinocorallia herbida]|uniref:hypothetical protein n=1 Tax=Actinocorallia herbida TaxID=58109 RepID=UPI000F4C80C4|nr:hypothetical protein [Actinocorallia herbida]